MDKKRAVSKLRREIEEMCTKYDLVLTVCDGRICLADKTTKNIVDYLEDAPCQ